MAAIQFADQFPYQIGEIVSMIHKGKQGRVFVAHRFPIHSVHVWRIKEIAHLPPALEVDLVPFRVPVEPQIKPFQFQLVIFPAFLVFQLQLVFWQIDHRIILVDLNQHLFAVARDLIIVNVSMHRLFAVFQVVGTKMTLFAAISVFVVIAPIVRHGPA